jgi:hypothetical protein
LRLADRNTIVGLDFLVIGVVISALGYIFSQSISITVVGLDLAIIGALIILIIPEPVPQDAYKALLQDSIANVEMILEESMLKEKAYFIPTEDGKIRAFIPISPQTSLNPSNLSATSLVQSTTNAPQRFISRFGGIEGLYLYPPGNEIVHLAQVIPESDLEQAVHHALIEVSDLASSIVLLEDKESKLIKVQIVKPKLSSEAAFFNSILGSPVSCVASCVVAAVRKTPIRLVEETSDLGLSRITLKIIE